VLALSFDFARFFFEPFFPYCSSSHSLDWPFFAFHLTFCSNASSPDLVSFLIFLPCLGPVPFFLCLYITVFPTFSLPFTSPLFCFYRPGPCVWKSTPSGSSFSFHFPPPPFFFLQAAHQTVGTHRRALAFLPSFLVFPWFPAYGFLP